MLLLLLLFLYISGVCFFTGIFISKGLLKLHFNNPLLYIAPGIITITTLARIWSLFDGIGLLFHALPIALTIAGIYYYRKEYRTGIGLAALLNDNKVLFSLSLLFILFFCSQQSISYDEALYHASFIEWQNQYGSITGLANLHGRLAFNSGWHIFSSVFNMRFLGGQAFNQVNGFFFLWMLLYFLKERELNKEDRNIRGFMSLAIIFLFFPLLTTYHLMGPSADYVIVFWSFLLLYEAFYYGRKDSGNSILFLIAISAVFLVTVKLSAAIVLLLGFLYLKEYRKQQQNIVVAAGISLAIVLPYLFSSYLMSGYIIYPYLQTSALSPWWKVPETMAETDLIGIKYSPFGRWLQMDYYSIAALPAFTRLKMLLLNIRLPEKLLYSTGLLAYVSITILSIARKRNFYEIAAIVTGFIGYIIVMMGAPDFRFAAGYIFFAYAVLFIYIVNIEIRDVATIALATCFAAASVGLYRHLKKTSLISNTPPGIFINLLKPKPYLPAAEKDTLIQGMRFKVFVEQKGQFHGNTIPALYTPIPPLRLKDSSDIRQGFSLGQ